MNLKKINKYFTKNNKKILDVSGEVGVLNLGHNHPEIIKTYINRRKK